MPTPLPSVWTCKIPRDAPDGAAPVLFASKRTVLLVVMLQ